MYSKILFLLSVFGCSFIVSYLVSLYLYKNSNRFKFGKKAYSERIRLHRKGIPRLGGIALYISFYLTFLIVYIFHRQYINNNVVKLIGIFLASTILVICGVYDDLIKRLSYKLKFAVQLLSCLIIIAFGYRVEVITNPFDGMVHVGNLGFLFIILWIIIIVNAINLMDGLDGLATGITSIVCIGFFAIEFYRGNMFPLLIIVILVGANLSFLKFNFSPAKLFLGDSGSLFLGFIIGILAMESSTKRSMVISLIVPLLTLFIPLASVLFTFSRRIAVAKNPFRPDKQHLHYRFLQAGISHKDTVLIYYSVAFIYASLGTFCFFMPKRFEMAIIVFAMVSMWILYLWALYFINSRRKKKREKYK